MIHVQNVSKTFVLHQQNGVRLPVLQNASLEVSSGECVVLHGHSGSGKSTLLRSLYANYLPDEGHIHIRHTDEWVDLVQASARKVLEVRRTLEPAVVRRTTEAISLGPGNTFRVFVVGPDSVPIPTPEHAA